MLEASDEGPGEDDRDAETVHRSRRIGSARRAKIAAAVLGVLGTLLALVVPFLPVHHNITTLKWPTAQGTESVSAPLVSFSPVWLDITVPCDTARSLDERTNRPATLISTNPPSSEYGKLTGLTLQVNNGHLSLLSKGRQLSTLPLPAGQCDFTMHSDGYGTKAFLGDQPMTNIRGDHRSQLTGIYSDLDESVDSVHGLSFEAVTDNRFATSATFLKFTTILLAVLCFLGAVFSLHKLDGRVAHRAPRWATRGWWKPTFRDISVIGALAIWWLIGAMTSDDGYVLSMIRSRESAGYVTNYFRWFANPESPFGWFYEVYAMWVQVSTSTPWVRLPALLMGIVSWLLISREVLPRLGQQVRRSNAAGWAAAAVFLAFWLPYNNGLRAEPVVVLFSLISLCAVERAVATRRLLPAALGLVAAALAVAANPHGLLAVLPFLAALKPLVHLVRQRVNEFGWLPPLAPLAASGFIILTAVFADQTWQSVMDATALKTEFGPNGKWFQELQRYSLLFSQVPDGSLTRRFPVLLVILCLATCAVVLLRRGKIRGAALGPSRRLLSVAVLSFVVLMLTPTKHTHHFGILAAFGGALAALTALATSGTVLRSKRNRAAFLAGLLVIFAFSATGPNSWWYVSGWGVPWFNRPPDVAGYQASTLLLFAAGAAGLVALIEHLRLDGNRSVLTGHERRSRALRLGTAPLSILCALLVIGEVAAFAKVIQERWGSYSLGADNVRQLAGTSCGLSDYVYVETNPQHGMLRVSAEQPSVSSPANEDMPIPPKRLAGREDADDYLRAKLEGFNRPGLPPGTGQAPNEPDWRPPYQFGGDNAPVWGSYDPAGVGTGELRTQWYDLPQRAINQEVPVVIALAGQETGSNAMVVEFGEDTPEGFEIVGRHFVGQSKAPQWRDHRITVGGNAEGATKMRVVALDQALGPNGWVAVSAPRAPQLKSMTQVVGDSPTFVEWPAALVHPCLAISGLRNGVAEMPEFRVAGGGKFRSIGQGWSSPDAGGPFGWLNVASSVRELPTYMQNDLHKDWGSLYAIDPYGPSALPAEAAMSVHVETHWGMWSPGPLTDAVHLPGDVPSSDDRTDIQPEEKPKQQNHGPR
ncbi:arabinosyltransferase domain-containing protein [Parasphingorhabdus pacifica]